MVAVAIIGGGITGSTLAHHLVRMLPTAKLTVFDQGRGCGGRTCHRRLDSKGGIVSPEDEDAALRFDHGCQFFRADSAEFEAAILSEWISAGWAAEWRARFGGDGDFFGLPFGDSRPVYAGVGGMHRIASSQLGESARSGRVAIQQGTRVACIERVGQRWELAGVSGSAAYHDTAEAVAAAAQRASLGSFDLVVCTDASMAQSAWHRASAGLPEDIMRRPEAQRLLSRVRVALFTSLVVFEPALEIPLDAVSLRTGPLWFAARSASKPGLSNSMQDCWSLV